MTYKRGNIRFKSKKFQRPKRIVFRKKPILKRTIPKKPMLKTSNSYLTLTKAKINNDYSKKVNNKDQVANKFIEKSQYNMPIINNPIENTIKFTEDDTVKKLAKIQLQQEVENEDKKGFWEKAKNFLWNNKGKTALAGITGIAMTAPLLYNKYFSNVAEPKNVLYLPGPSKLDGKVVEMPKNEMETETALMIPTYN